MTHEREASEGFEALAHPTRMGVLRALFEANRGSERGELRFSELRERVDAPDSGNFSYHLDRLTGLYVASTDAGYRLTSRGFEVGLALLSETHEEGSGRDPIEDFGRCLFCDSTLDARFGVSGGGSALVCSRGHRMHLTRLPPEAIEARSREELRALAATELYAVFGRASRGVCAACRSPVSGELAYDEGFEGHLFRTACEACGVQYAAPCGLLVLQDPEILHFLHERGVDPWTTPPWDFAFCHLGVESVRSTDPLRVRVDVHWEGDERSVILDGHASVREVVNRR